MQKHNHPNKKHVSSSAATIAAKEENRKSKTSGLLGYLLLLTILFIFVEISLFIQENELYLGSYTLIADQIKIPRVVIPAIVYFFSIQLFLHVLFTFFIWGMARLIAIACHCSWKTTEKIGFSLWGIGLLTLLLANQYYFPNTKFANLLNVFLPSKMGIIFLFVFLGVLLIAFLISVWGLILLSSKKIKIFSAILMGLVVSFLIVAQPFKPSQMMDAATVEKPNIIFIGIDSLRPDFLGYFGYEKYTPHLDDFLNQSAVFTDAFTPLARTFPAWVGILSGQYPKNSGIRTNIPNIKEFNSQNTLSSILQKQGYETVFATDETRFSNIDASFGFDKSITPPIGFNDFFLGSLNDFPLANLLVNTPLGRYLFPYSYANRPAFLTYDPNSFLDFLKPTLAKSRNKPLFFAVHFCLPHFPYVWAAHSAEEKGIRNYQASIQRVDQQFHDFIALLKHYKLLNHAIVVVLSDHGEALELQGDRVTDEDLFISNDSNKKQKIPRFYPPTVESEAVNESAGHGTDVLGLSQYHVLLAFRTFGLKENQTTPIIDKVSLLDIKPTILDFIHYSNQTTDGHSLKSLILEKPTKPIPEYHFFIESDFSPQSVRSVHPETCKILFEGIQLYQINPLTGRVSVKENMIPYIISSKQYADIYDKWILALYPQNKTQMMPILVNLDTGEWTNNLKIPFATASPAREMLKALKDFYGKDLTHIENS